eukprot:scaffold50805_cov31-Tisochrysis_lutea.AAC.2
MGIGWLQWHRPVDRCLKPYRRDGLADCPPCLPKCRGEQRPRSLDEIGRHLTSLNRSSAVNDQRPVWGCSMQLSTRQADTHAHYRRSACSARPPLTGGGQGDRRGRALLAKD